MTGSHLMQLFVCVCHQHITLPNCFLIYEYLFEVFTGTTEEWDGRKGFLSSISKLSHHHFVQKVQFQCRVQQLDPTLPRCIAEHMLNHSKKPCCKENLESPENVLLEQMYNIYLINQRIATCSFFDSIKTLHAIIGLASV